jgi:AcrR family transcriptional regulator
VQQAAEALFAANGFASATLSELARRARLSKPGIYYHVRDKDELLFRICDGGMRELLRVAREAVARAGDPVERMRGLVRAHAHLCLTQPQTLAVLFGQIRYLSPARRRRVFAIERRYLDLVRGVVRAGQRAGMFRDVDPSVAAFSLFAMLNTLHAWYDPRGRVAPDALVTTLERLYLAGLARDGAARRLTTPAPRARTRARPRRPARRRSAGRRTPAAPRGSRSDSRPSRRT